MTARLFLAELVVCAFHIPPYVSSALTLAWQRENNFYLDQLGTVTVLHLLLHACSHIIALTLNHVP